MLIFRITNEVKNSISLFNNFKLIFLFLNKLQNVGNNPSGDANIKLISLFNPFFN